VTRNFTFTLEAEADVLVIWERVADDGSENRADQVIARIYDECQKLGDMPGMGHYREDIIDQRHKFWTAWSYLIVYRWQVAPIQIIAVIHGARDLDAVLATRQT
jgi:plasmid stabilization system protein ParE